MTCYLGGIAIRFIGFRPIARMTWDVAKPRARNAKYDAVTMPVMNLSLRHDVIAYRSARQAAPESIPARQAGERIFRQRLSVTRGNTDGVSGTRCHSHNGFHCWAGRMFHLASRPRKRSSIDVDEAINIPLVRKLLSLVAKRTPLVRRFVATGGKAYHELHRASQ